MDQGSGGKKRLFLTIFKRQIPVEGGFTRGGQKCARPGSGGVSEKCVFFKKNDFFSKKTTFFASEGHLGGPPGGPFI